MCNMRRVPRPEWHDHRINQNIENNEVRLIDENGEMVGVVPLSAALERAQAAGLDLVEVSPNAAPPVCKILDYGKFKYEAQKKASAARRKQRVIDVKEIKMRYKIEDHECDSDKDHVVYDEQVERGKDLGEGCII